MKVTVKMFALARQLAGSDQLSVELPQQALIHARHEQHRGLIGAEAHAVRSVNDVVRPKCRGTDHLLHKHERERRLLVIV